MREGAAILVITPIICVFRVPSSRWHANSACFIILHIRPLTERKHFSSLVRQAAAAESQGHMGRATERRKTPIIWVPSGSRDTRIGYTNIKTRLKTKEFALLALETSSATDIPTNLHPCTYLLNR